jgi:hypothetical protein
VVGVEVVVVRPVDDGLEDEDPPAVGVAVVAGVDAVAVDLAGVDEWAVASEATRTPKPMALAAAPMPMTIVVRRTRDIAWSRALAADGGVRLLWGC